MGKEKHKEKTEILEQKKHLRQQAFSRPSHGSEFYKNEKSKMSFLKGTHFRQFEDRMPLKKGISFGTEEMGSSLSTMESSKKQAFFRPYYYNKQIKKEPKNILKRSVSTGCLSNFSLPFNTISSNLVRFSSFSLPSTLYNSNIQDYSFYRHEFAHSNETLHKKSDNSKLPGKYTALPFYFPATKKMTKPGMFLTSLKFYIYLSRDGFYCFSDNFYCASNSIAFIGNSLYDY